ncbi:hypothetical protein C9374_010221 [Naegleria lovaniensis]|uniref:Uncharacterized protein n=1 Tax=Naegleria lovaniensis TaxID=51637 RepID=A0AA88KBN7_NAELO|nr:uncharacterized protein C9374_012807 [Naegleria lovaniensis]XP_044544021.1 uncharacterized protein C9374_010221 [Naegleria lovaniensis]KAG2373205.1 hypothetical protein C9374_012807 [Naegleria lovaniensis]KAG2374847.1 hypothetical protein C9374_010221 [Naegleria lovaniensis]
MFLAGRGRGKPMSSSSSSSDGKSHQVDGSAEKSFSATNDHADGEISSRDSTTSSNAPTSYSAVIMDEFGNLVDETGKIIQSRKTVVTTKINQRRQKEKKENALKIEKPPSIKKQEIYDPSLGLPSADRKKRKRGLEFHEKGEFIEKARIMRELEEEERQKALLKQQLEAEKKEQDRIQKEQERERLIQEEKEIGELHLMLGCRRVEDYESTIPDAFWWDKRILKSFKKGDDSRVDSSIDPYERDYDTESSIFKIKEKMVKHNFVEHPVIVEPLKKKVEIGPLPLMLTKKEQKKMRTQQRIQREKEKQRKIKLGLIPPPPPKANMGNYMKALLGSGEDPTELEMRIKREIAERVKAHEERMEAQKLTKEEKRERKIRKINEDAEYELIVALYSIPNLAHPQTRFKINTAKEKGVTGAVLSCANQNNDKKRILLIAEGGKKSLKAYDHVLLNRIDWTKRETSEEESNIDRSEPDSAKLLWKGTILKRNFQYFKFQQFETEESIKNYLKDHGCSHYFDIFQNDLNNVAAVL